MGNPYAFLSATYTTAVAHLKGTIFPMQLQIFPKGAIVFAKTIGYEPYPATVTRYNPIQNVYSVSFINYKSHAIVALNEIEQFNSQTVQYYRQKYASSSSKEHQKILRSIKTSMAIHQRRSRKQAKRISHALHSTPLVKNQTPTITIKKESEELYQKGLSYYQSSSIPEEQPALNSNRMIEEKPVNPIPTQEKPAQIMVKQEEQEISGEQRPMEVVKIEHKSEVVKPKKLSRELWLLSDSSSPMLKSNIEKSGILQKKTRRIVNKNRVILPKKEQPVMPTRSSAGKNRSKNKVFSSKWCDLSSLPKIEEVSDQSDSKVKIQKQQKCRPVKLENKMYQVKIEHQEKVRASQEQEAMAQFSWNIFQEFKDIPESDLEEQTPNLQVKKEGSSFIGQGEYLQLFAQISYQHSEMLNCPVNILLSQAQRYVKILGHELAYSPHDGKKPCLLSMTKKLTLLATLEFNGIPISAWAAHPILKTLFDFVLVYENTNKLELKKNCQIEYLYVRGKLNILCTEMLSARSRFWANLCYSHELQLEAYYLRAINNE